MNKLGKVLFFLATAGIIFSGCVKQEFDQPEKQNIPVGSALTIAELRQMAIDSITNVPGASNYRFTEDYSLYAVVTMDEASAGNLYKSVYIQDGTGAINLQLLYSGSLYQGDSIRIHLKDLLLQPYNNAMQIDSVDIEKDIVKIATGKIVEPVSVSLADLETGLYEATLIKLEDVQFIQTDLGKTWADFEVNTNRTIEDCDGRTILVRTSGWANFYGDTLPSGKGSLVAVASVYGTDLQIYVRSIGEVHLDSTRCGGGGGASYLSKDYTDGNVFSGGWTEQKVIGNISWSIYSGSNNAAQITNYNYVTLSNTACETWYISPSVDLSASTSPVFNFRNVCRYNGSAMVVYVSTDYTSGTPSTATWTTLTCNLDANTSVWTWVDSGDVDFSAYKTSNVHVAFKYTGTDSDGRTWEIDDIYIQEP